MRIRNICRNTIYIEDIDFHLPYRNGEVEEIDSDILKKSKCLRGFIINGMLEVVEHDPNERIEASVVYLRNKFKKEQSYISFSPQSELEKPAELVELDNVTDDIEVRIHGIFYEAGGYGKVNRNFALKLHDAGIKVKVDAKRTKNQLRESELTDILKLTKTNISRSHISIDSIIPSFAEYYTGTYRILYTTIESYTVPKQFLECCELYNEIWITSEWSAAILRKFVKKPIYVIPAGIDNTLYTENGPKFDFSPNVKDFVFISVFGWGYRKGYDVLLRAYFDEFDANDNVSLLIVSRYQSQATRFHRNKIKNDIDEFMKEFPNKDMPHVVRYSQIIPEAQMPQLYRSGNCFVLPTRGEGSCCVAGTKVSTENGLINIESIVENDRVLTHNGKFLPVIKTMNRYIDEPIIHVYTTMNGNLPIRITEEHPILILPRYKILKNNKKDISKFNISNCEWQKARDIKCSDYVVFPLNFSLSKDLKKIHIQKYFRHSSIILENGLVYRSINGKKHPTCSPIFDTLNITNDLLRFIGMYIAEGWCGFNTKKNKGCISLTFHKKETEYHNHVVKVMKTYFNQHLQLNNYFKDDRKFRHAFYCDNTLCSELFASWCGVGSSNKHLPDFSWQLSKEQRLALIRGIFEGDGCFYDDQSSPCLSLSSISERLIDEVMLLLRSVGINGCKQTKKDRGFLISIKGQQLNELNFIKNSMYNTKKKTSTVSVKNGNYIFLPIKKIETHRYEGEVYNLEIEQDNSYVTNCFVVHNCCIPGTKIITSTGLKKIETIANDEYVLTHMGRFKRVTHTMKRKIREKIYSIKTLTNDSVIKITGNHPVLVLRKNKCWKVDRKMKKEFNLKNCEWTKVETLQKGDYLIFPIKYARDHELKEVSLCKYLNINDFIFENNRIYRKSTNQFGAIFKHSTSKSYPVNIHITHSLLRMIGFYIAEGYIYPEQSKISFTLNEAETEYYNDILNSLRDNFNQSAEKVKSKHSKALQICCSNYILSKILQSWCGNSSRNKHLPDFVWKLNKEQIIQLIYGLFSGDGCVTKLQEKSLPYITLTTVSQKLAEEVVILLRSIGINSRKYNNKNDTFSVNVNGKKMNDLCSVKDAYHNGITKEYCIYDDKYLFMPITMIEKKDYCGEVYNLEIEQDNSYVTDCFIVHNCLTAPEASLCGLPVIMTNVSGQQQYLRPDNAFLIEMDHLVTMRAGQMHLHYWDGQKFPALTSEKVHNQLKENMRYVINNPEEAQQRNKRLQKLILEKFTWNNTTNIAIKRLQQIKKEIS